MALPGAMSPLSRGACRRVRHVMSVLEREKHKWFDRALCDPEPPAAPVGPNKWHMVATTRLIQVLILPRCVFSPSDALFCAKFMDLVGGARCRSPPSSVRQRPCLTAACIPLFPAAPLDEDARILLVLLLPKDRPGLNQDREQFSARPPLPARPSLCSRHGPTAAQVPTLTEAESKNFAIFLRETLRTVYRWKDSQADYDKECANHPGFAADPNVREPPAPHLALRGSLLAGAPSVSLLTGRGGQEGQPPDVLQPGSQDVQPPVTAE